MRARDKRIPRNSWASCPAILGSKEQRPRLKQSGKCQLSLELSSKVHMCSGKYAPASYKGMHADTTTHTIYSHTPYIHILYSCIKLPSWTFFFLNFLISHAIIKDEYRNTNLIFFKLEIPKVWRGSPEIWFKMVEAASTRRTAEQLQGAWKTHRDSKGRPVAEEESAEPTVSLEQLKQEILWEDTF